MLSGVMRLQSRHRDVSRLQSECPDRWIWRRNTSVAICTLQAISLALAALSFDFVGTCLDESSEDLGTIQVLRFRTSTCVALVLLVNRI